MMTRQAELYGGPMDGVIMQIADEQRVVLARRPTMTAQQMIALDIVHPGAQRIDLVEYVYILDVPSHLTRAGNLGFHYTGERTVT
jgi:hypothetical protein